MGTMVILQIMEVSTEINNELFRGLAEGPMVP